jgi:hypothetical protein
MGKTRLDVVLCCEHGLVQNALHSNSIDLFAIKDHMALMLNRLFDKRASVVTRPSPGRSANN